MITKLKMAISASGLKQIHIAKKIKVDHTLLSKWVTGEREIPYEMVKKIANVLKVRQGDIK